MMLKSVIRNCFIRASVIALILLLTPSLHSQDFKIIKINTSQYPIIKAIFIANNTIGKKIVDAKPSDFTISESETNCDIIEVTNPKEITTPASIAMVFDVSLSMAGERLNLAKKAAKGFIEQIPLESSEVAIVSFSDGAYVNCDFTQSQDRLFDAIESLGSIGGTNYTNAFLNEPSGALSITRNGRYKRYILFLTDGLSNTDVAEIVSRAKQENVTIYCITLELPIPDILRNISTQTGGKYFEALANINQLDGVYSSIFQTLEVTKYGTITWKASSDCKKDRNVHLLFRNKPIDFTYDIPKNKTGTLEIDPSLLAFGKAPVGVNKNLSVDIIARNIPLNLTHISVAGKGPFSVADSLSFPILLKPDRVKNIMLTYKPNDFKMVSDKLIVSTRECPDKNIALLGGSDEQLQLICPKGGEKLIVGTDTSIRWEGIKKDKRISVSYRTHPDKPWVLIDEAAGLILPWPTPNDTSNQAQVKLSPSKDESGELFLSATMPNQRSGLRGAFFSNDGTKFITTDRIGSIKVWDTGSGRSISTIEGFRSNTAIFSNNDKYILSFSKDETMVWDTQTSKLANRQIMDNRLLYTSYILPDGTEKLLSCNVLKDMANTYKLWMPGLNHSAFIFEKEFIQSATLSLDGTKGLTWSSDNVLKIWDINKATAVVSSYQPGSPISIIISPNGKTALVVGPGTITMIELKNGNELFHNQRYVYKRFTDSGEMIIARSLDNNNTVFLDSYTGKIMTSVGNSSFYKCLSKGYKILFYKNDSIIIDDVYQHKRLFQIYKPATLDAVVSEDDSKVMTITQSNVIDIYDINNKLKPVRIGEIDNAIKTALFSTNGKSIMVLMNDNSMQYWSPQGVNDTKEVLSGYFSIISPKPKVKKIIQFDDQFIHQPKELLIKDFITNPTHYPVKINKIELVNTGSADFDIVSDGYPYLLSPLNKKSGEFRFTPNNLGHRKSWVRTCTPTDTFLTEIIGNGIRKNFETTALNINFGKLNIHQYRDTLTSVIQNRNAESLIVTDIIQAGPDKQQFSFIENRTENKTNRIIQPNDWLKVKVRFAPKFRGKTSGSLQIKIQGSTEPQIIQLNGEGLAAKEVWICGKTLDSKDSVPLFASVNCVDLSSNSVIKNIKTDAHGNFNFKINADRNYGLVGEKTGYLSTSENIDIREATLADTIRRNIYLTEIKTGARIRMNCLFFEFAKAKLLTSSKNELNRIVDLLNSHPSIIVELQGHTDSIGSDASNMQLSALRASAVRNYLIKQGIKAERLSAKAFGESVPLALNSSEEGRQLNRRVELKIIKY